MVAPVFKSFQAEVRRDQPQGTFGVFSLFIFLPWVEKIVNQTGGSELREGANVTKNGSSCSKNAKRCGICRYLELWSSLPFNPELPHQVMERMERKDNVSLNLLKDICLAVSQLPLYFFIISSVKFLKGRNMDFKQIKYNRM